MRSEPPPRPAAVRWYYRVTAALGLACLIHVQLKGHPLNWFGFACCALFLSLYIVQGESK